MKRRMNLSEAGQLLGLSVNGMRARAKKEPVKYGREVDNEGRIWLVFDPDALEPSKPSRTVREPIDRSGSEATIAALKAERDAAFRARDVAEADRDRWQAMAERLAGRRRSWWPWA